MIRNATTAGLAVVLASCLATAASAATISEVSGPVLVDSGKGFVKVSARSELPAGSRVLVSKAGKAVLAYADGCAKTLAPNSITTVVTSGACQPAAQVAAQDGATQSALAGVSPFVWAGAAGVAGGLIGYAIGESNNSDTYVYVPISR